MAIPLDAAAAALRDAMRETVKRYSLWYLIQGILLVVAGVWVLIVSGILQGIGLIGASNLPHYWLQLISAALAILIGVLLLREPESGLLIMTVLLIVYFMVEGIAKVIFALTIRPFPNWGWVLGSGFVGILLALILWANMPLSADWVLGLMLGLLLISEGAALTYLAWHVRSSAAPKAAG